MAEATGINPTPREARQINAKKFYTALDTKILTHQQVVESRRDVIDAGVRSVANLLVSASLVVSPSFAKNFVAFAGQRIFEKCHIEPFPDVNKFKLTGGNIVRPILSLLGAEGLFYSIDTLRQFIGTDIPTMFRAVQSAIAEKRGEVKDFRQNGVKIKQAAQAFGQNIAGPAHAAA